jgi:hypothetical protein
LESVPTVEEPMLLQPGSSLSSGFHIESSGCDDAELYDGMVLVVKRSVVVGVEFLLDTFEVNVHG